MSLSIFLDQYLTGTYLTPNTISADMLLSYVVVLSLTFQYIHNKQTLSKCLPVSMILALVLACYFFLETSKQL